MPEGRDSPGLGSVERRVGPDDADRRVRLAEPRRDTARAELPGRVHQPASVGGVARAGEARSLWIT